MADSEASSIASNSVRSTKKGKSKESSYARMSVYCDDGFIWVEAIEARNVKPSQAYVKCYIMPDSHKRTKQKSKQVKKTANPFWGDSLRWPISDIENAPERTLQVSLWGGRDFLGRFSVPLADILPPDGRKLDGWFLLFDSSKGKDQYHLVDPPDISKLYVAMYDHDPRDKFELYMKRGDYLQVISDEGQYKIVRNAITGQQGAVPNSFLAPAASLDSEPWFFGPIRRSKAEKLLKSPLRKHGCFLVRESESQPGSYSLSMKDGDDVRHFRIIEKEGEGFKLQGSPSHFHQNIPELIEYHKQKRAGLTTTLKEPCPKEQPTTALDLAFGVRDEWEIDRNSIELEKLLGQGQYGEVYKGVWNGTTPVAVKTLKSDTTTAEEFLHEAQLMKKLKHEKLVQLYAVCSLGEPIFIILELMPHGCLLDFLKTPVGASLRLPQLIDMANDIAAGMFYLESNKFIHRDLAARNILVGENNVCKVSDFGLARVVQDQVYSPENLEKFPVRWTAPEAMKRNEYSIKSDVWSFGITLTEIITYGRKPYQGMTNKEVVSHVESGKRMERPPGCPEALYTIMLDCWKANPLERPTFESLVYRLEDFFGSQMQYTEAKNVTPGDD